MNDMRVKFHVSFDKEELLKLANTWIKNVYDFDSMSDLYGRMSVSLSKEEVRKICLLVCTGVDSILGGK